MRCRERMWLTIALEPASRSRIGTRSSITSARGFGPEFGTRDERDIVADALQGAHVADNRVGACIAIENRDAIIDHERTRLWAGIRNSRRTRHRSRCVAGSACG